MMMMIMIYILILNNTQIHKLQNYKRIKKEESQNRRSLPLT